MVTLEFVGPLLEYGIIWLASKVPGPLFLVSCRCHWGLVNVLTMLLGRTRSITMSSLETVLQWWGRRPTWGLVWLLPWSVVGNTGSAWRTATTAASICSDSFQPELKGWPMSYRNHLQKATRKWWSNTVLHANDRYSSDSLPHTSLNTTHTSSGAALRKWRGLWLKLPHPVPNICSLLLNRETRTELTKTTSRHWSEATAVLLQRLL